ncbi:MAG: trimethylamine methyltransferase [Chloroflexi bacterium]|nr:MAG: trimethylamine methyltransferase [Chloroflexota bacterium]
MRDREQRRSSRREKRRQRRAVPAAVPVKPLRQLFAPYRVLDEEGIEAVHRASMRLLKEVGILIVDYSPLLDTFRAHGAKIEDNLVKIDEDTLMHFVRQAPPSFTLLARDPANNMPIGGPFTVFAPVYGPPFVADLDNGRRQATLEDFKNFVKLTYMTPYLHHSGGTVVEPNDIPVPVRHLDMLMAHITLSSKGFMGSVTHPDNARDTVAMAEILFGPDTIRQNPAVISLINVSSPLRFDDRMLGALEVYARARQAVVVTPFIVAGAMSPATMAGTLAQQNAEALFGIAYAQMINPGTPCVYGSFLSNIDMKTGAPCFGTPENALALFAGAQMARYYNLPYRSGGNFTAACSPDAQAGYESASTIWPTILAGVNFVLHAAGWLEGGLIAGYEKFILDLEMCGMMTRFMQGIGLTEDDFAWDAFQEAGPGQHFLGTQHTTRHYETAFYQHSVFSMDNYEKWAEDGSPTAFQRANAIWKRMLKAYEPPPLDPAIAEQLEDFVTRRRAEIQNAR